MSQEYLRLKKIIVCGSLPQLPAASFSLCLHSVLCSCPPPTPTRTDVDSCLQGLPVNHFCCFCTLQLCALGHPHLLEVLRDAGWLAIGAPRCLEVAVATWRPSLLCFRGLGAWLPRRKRRREAVAPVLQFPEPQKPWQCKCSGQEPYS